MTSSKIVCPTLFELKFTQIYEKKWKTILLFKTMKPLNKHLLRENSKQFC